MIHIPCPRVIGLAAVVAAAIAAGVSAPGVYGAEDAKVDYSRDIRPILSANCYQCHGPDAESRQAGLRLDQKTGALGKGESGETAVLPGKPQESELVRRITSADEDERMPPADSNKHLKPEQIELLRRWVAQGAPWQEHWSLIRPQKAALPQVKNESWPRGAIDRFILARLEKEGLAPSPEADRTTLIRRVTFDLTGLPPTPEEVDAFLADESPKAYERLVMRLLQSPRYGEHMARFWLDAARYGDTHGLHLDNYREIWPYRDWVVRALNQNMPYRQFTIEQLAGDLLPGPEGKGPTLDQLIATGFNRCNVSTSEGGSIDEEVYVRNVVDRVVTVGTVFMGMTFDCTRCHDHKYDALTMKDFYSMFAYFNSLDGNAMDGNAKDHAPVANVLSDEAKDKIAALRPAIDETRAEIRKQLDAFVYAEPANPAKPTVRETVWIDDNAPQAALVTGEWKFVSQPSPVFSGSKAVQRVAPGTTQDVLDNAQVPLEVGKNAVLFAHVFLDPKNPPKQIMLQFNDGTWEHRAYWGGNHIGWGADNSPSRRHKGALPEAGKWVRLEVTAAEVGLAAGSKIKGWAFTQHDGSVYWDKAGIASLDGAGYDSLAAWASDQKAAGGAGLLKEIANVVRLDADMRTPAQQKQLQDYFLEHIYTGSRDVFDPLNKKIALAEAQIAAAEKEGAATSLIYRERKQPRTAYLLHRGEYDQRREARPRATPASLPPMPKGAPDNRLGFAQWLVDPSHPLTSRVAVNRFWQQCFGVGIVKTSEDFGSQGDVPSHPELLDWLAVQFIEEGWDVKDVMKQIVMSAAYRQSSRVTPELFARDPENRLLARGPRFRLDAEMLRDQALAVSGLLVNKVGGPSVKPPQPDGLWFAVGYSGSNTVRFKKDTGPDKVYRRALYTFIKRTAPPPQMSTFDGPSRESCVLRRERTNTPLQALLLMNDPQFVEAARALAGRVMNEKAPAPEATAARIYRIASGRHADEQTTGELVSAYRDHLKTFQAKPDDAKRLISIGESKPDANLDPAQLAAWTMVANLVLNLDAVVSKN